MSTCFRVFQQHQRVRAVTPRCLIVHLQFPRSHFDADWWLMMIENSVHLMPIPRTVHEIWIFHFAALNLSPDFLLSQVRHQHDHSNESRVMSQCVRPGRDIMATFSTPHFLLFVFLSQTPGSHPVSLLPIVQSAFVLPRVAKCTQKANRQMSTEEFPWKKMT